MEEFSLFRDPNGQKRRSRRWLLRHRYGIEEHEFDNIMQQQSGKCAIRSCQNRAEFIDHDHDTDAVRGLLCKHCNWLLGHADENPQILRDAAEYIEIHRQKKAVQREPLPPLPRLPMSPEEREWRRQRMLGNTHGFPKGKTPWNKGKKMPPGAIAKMQEARVAWWESLNEEQRERQRQIGRLGSQKRWDSLSKEQREKYQQERRESLNEKQRETLRVGRQKRWEK